MLLDFDTVMLLTLTDSFSKIIPALPVFLNTSRVVETVHVTLKLTLKVTPGKSLLNLDPAIPADFGLTKLLKGSLATNLTPATT